MIKVRVNSVFIDKNTKERYKVDDELSISKERYNEIKEFVEIITKKDSKNNNGTENQN